MDRELLIEIGCEEIPASWLPGLTSQVASHLDARLKGTRLTSDRPAESYSTPRRLTARAWRSWPSGRPITKSWSRGRRCRPPSSRTASRRRRPTGFAKKYGVEVSALERSQTPKGAYLAYRVHQRGKATVDVLADVLGGLLRDLTFPKQMRWDAYLEDGKGDLVFARPIRWLILLYGGRVVPFVIRRTELAQGPLVQDIRSGPNTYGHRFLTTSGRAGRAIKVKTFEDYEARLLENFVILESQRARVEDPPRARDARAQARWARQRPGRRRSRRCCRKCPTSSSIRRSSRDISRWSSSSCRRKC